jgi:7,8-dihydropterin-6-yl-methyl-4-(beta-D-ribofuranosyl)aminobenzene 5'-phosphate synthase
MSYTPWRLQILINNYTRHGSLQAEHGLSLLLSRGSDNAPGGARYLLDTGQTAEVLLSNAEKLGVDWDGLTGIILSHGHYDHTGGLAGLLGLIPGEVPVYAHPEAFGVKLNSRPEVHDIGSPVSTFEVEEYGGKVELFAGARHLEKDFIVTGEVPRVHDFEKEASAGFKTRVGGVVVDDPIPDDLSIVIVAPGKGIFLICGCCHAGLLNTLDYALSVSGESRVIGILGGLHTIGASEGRLDKTIARLKSLDLEWVAPLHCAGVRETSVIHGAMGDKVLFPAVGDVIEL